MNNLTHTQHSLQVAPPHILATRTRVTKTPSTKHIAAKTTTRQRRTPRNTTQHSKSFQITLQSIYILNYFNTNQFALNNTSSDVQPSRDI
jgi:hypothetical protein